MGDRRAQGTSGAPLAVSPPVASDGVASAPLLRPGSGRLAADRRSRTLRVLARVSEARLVRAARQGSEEAVAELFARHWSRAHRTALLVTGDGAAAEDIAQESFLAALRALPSFDVRRPLGPWLQRIVVNRAIDFSRARALRHEVDAATVPEPQAPDAAAGLAPDDELVAALRGLGAEQRAVIVLRYLLDLTPGEISRLLDLPRGTVNSRLRRGLDALGAATEERRR